MADDARIEELRRRVRREPASLAFAQLAEELRRARRFLEAVAVCRAGLEVYPGYLSARVTLGRCFIDLKRLDDAEKELEKVREVAPENLVAVRALAELRERRSASSGHTAGIGRPAAPDTLLASSAGRLVEGPDATYDGATFEVRPNPDFTYDDGTPPARLKPDSTYDGYDDGHSQVRLPRDSPGLAGRSEDGPLLESGVGHALQGVPRVSGPMGRDSSSETLKTATPYKGYDVGNGQVRPGPRYLEPDTTYDGVKPDMTDLTYDSATAELRLTPDDTHEKDLVKTLAALEAWLDAIHVTRAIRRA